MSEIVPPEKNGLAMGLMTFNSSIAITIGVYLFSGLMAAAEGRVTGTYPFAAGLLAVTLIIEVFCNIRKKN